MIRPYQNNDLEAVLQVWRDAAEVAYQFLSANQLMKEEEEIRLNYLPTAETWVYEHDGQIIGFISLLDSFIGGLFIAPSCQHRGIGQQLIEHARRLHGSLSLDVFRENFQARRFYEHCGFVIVEEGIDEQTGFPDLTMTMGPFATSTLHKEWPVQLSYK